MKLAAIGDVVMALPMLTALREAAPSSRIAWLCGETVQPLLACVRGIDELIAIDDAGLLAGGASQQAAVVARTWRVLAGRRFDRVLLAHADARYRHLIRTLRAGEVRSLEPRGPRSGLLPGRSHADEYVRLVTGVDDHRARAYAPPPVDAPLPRDLEERLPSGAPLVALAPGGARNVARDNPLRRWPVDRYVMLADHLRAAGCTVLLTGAASDDWVRAPFAGTATVDLVGRTDLPSLVALYRRCAAVVTHDSGPLHLAGLAGAPRVALFGPTPPTSFARPEARTRVLWPAAALPCAPCYDGRDFAACDDNVCMQAIGVDDALRGVLDLLGR